MKNTTRRALFGVAAVYIASQALPVTKLVYWPSEVWIDGSEVTVDRSFPGDMLGLPRPRISFVETVHPLTDGHNDGQVCQVSGGPFVYDSDEPLGRWKMGDWADECLNDPKGYRWAAEWTWHIGGFTLGNVRLEKTVINQEAGNEQAEI